MLHLPTLLLFQVSITVLTTLLLTAEALTADALREQRLWAWGNIFACVGLVVGAMTFMPTLVHGALSYGLMGLGQALLYRGLRIFCGRDLSTRTVAAIALTAFLLPAYFVVVQPSLNGRLIVSGLYFGAIGFVCAATLIRHLRDAARRVMWISVTGFVALALALLGRGLYVLWSPLDPGDEQGADTVMNIGLFILPLAQIAITAGLLIMVSHRFAEKLQRLRLLDPLTGANNRAGLMTLGPRILHRARRDRQAVAVAMLDADHFKRINDTYGHPVGDEVLRHLSKILSAQVRPGDLVVRYGGEEFLLMLRGMTIEEAVPVAERLRRHIAATPAEVETGPLSFQVSVGLSASPQTGYDMEALIAAADKALYRAKQEGRNRVCAALPG